MADELPSKAQLDKLGERLRGGSRDELDIRGLDDYRRSFRPAFDSVSSVVERLGIVATGRPAKTTTAIVDKLIRQNVRLTQIQDIAGLRLVVRDTSEQDQIVDQLRAAFDKVVIVDRREKPSHGYRAVHVIVTTDGKSIEIQVRTRAQHLWAEISEKLADTVDKSVKYGGGPTETRETLKIYSDAVKSIEDSELALNKARRDHADLEREAGLVPATDPHHLKLVSFVERHRRLILEKELTDSRFNSELLALLEQAYNAIWRNQ